MVTLKGSSFMRIFKSVLFLALFLIGLTFLAVFTPSHAAKSVGPLSILNYLKSPENKGYTSPYLNDALRVNNAQWDMEEWDISRWQSSDGQGIDLVKHFYDSGLITDQYQAKQGLILEVSDLFLRLSDQDKRKIVLVVDDAYGVTLGGGPGGFFIEHDRTNSIIGAYTQHGLQLQ